LAAAASTGLSIYEAEDRPGGICSSYYMKPGASTRLDSPPCDKNAYRFETCGGHWIFGAEGKILKFIRRFAAVKKYERRSSVYFPDKNLYVPYPLQNNLRFLGKDISGKVLKELSKASASQPKTMKEWLKEYFKPTLCNLFFYPFQRLYTDNLYNSIAPQDNYKTPINMELIIAGVKSKTPQTGYNAVFAYPKGGLDIMIDRMAEKTDIHYEKRAEKIDLKNRQVFFSDGSGVPYKKIISTIPLNQMLEICGLKLKEKTVPYTSVLTLNIGALAGKNASSEHWLYIPQGSPGFFRVGFYSNVDSSFLPKSLRKNKSRVSLYAERAYRYDHTPSEEEKKEYIAGTIAKLQSWGFIGKTEVVDPTWIKVAYTWNWPGSAWREKAIALLKKHGIYQIGRYGAWKFQGISESIKDGLSAKILK
jgi:protoporphyrinogen oxidase